MTTWWPHQTHKTPRREQDTMKNRMGNHKTTTEGEVYSNSFEEHAKYDDADLWACSGYAAKHKHKEL
jgi:L-fucose isomerase-like protein